LPGAGLKAINKRIRSVKSTQQITKAMKMVAAAKLQRSQGRMLNARPYSQKLVELLQQLAGGGDGQASHPLFEQREVKRRLFIVITSDKGLCGAYNMNIMRLAQTEVDRSVADGIATQIYAVGKKARDYFRRREYTLFAEHIDFGGEATAERSNLVGDAVVNAFLDGAFDEVRLVYSQFHSTVRQKPASTQFLLRAWSMPSGMDRMSSPAQAARTKVKRPSTKKAKGLGGDTLFETRLHFYVISSHGRAFSLLPIFISPNLQRTIWM